MAIQSFSITDSKPKVGGIFINGRPNDEWNYYAGPWVKAQNTEINIETPLVINN
ncbi:hypothetical protein [Sphingobacterium siyangense]|uniref:hypothetical protein n=1 Tax=Sphingobacterium siyangense TaxID=459529 RepID=UPI0031F9490F